MFEIYLITFFNDRTDEYHLLNDVLSLNLFQFYMNLEFSILFLDKSAILLKSKYEVHILNGIRIN